MLLVIRTQDQENYAAHGGFNGTYRWKYKGGYEYKVVGIPAGTDYAALVKKLAPTIEEDNNYFISTIIDWSLEDDDYLSNFEKSQLEYEGEIRFPSPFINFNEIDAKLAKLKESI